MRSRTRTDRGFTFIELMVETDTLITNCPPGQHPVPATGKCVPNDTLLDDTAIGLIHGLDVRQAARRCRRPRRSRGSSRRWPSKW